MFSVQNGGSNGLDPLDDESESPGDKETGSRGGIADVVYRATMKTFKEYEKLLRRFQKKKTLSEYCELCLNTKSESISYQRKLIICEYVASTLTARQRLLCNPMVRGFCLSSKKWGEQLQYHEELGIDKDANSNSIKRSSTLTTFARSSGTRMSLRNLFYQTTTRR